jgi:hypothetical protein
MATEDSTQQELKIMFFKKIACIAALSTSAIASFTYAGSAHAIDFTYSAGSYQTPGVTDQGAFSPDVNNPNTQTIDFNNADSSFSGNNLVNYSFSGGTPSTSVNQQTGIISDNWAPTGVNGQTNNSKYLAVFDNSSVDIKLKTGGVFNQFGLDVGSLSGGNTLQFLNNGTAVPIVYQGKTYTTMTYDLMNSIANVVSQANIQGGQKNGFFSFFSTSAADNFNEIKLSQVGGGGFETDNHTFSIASGAYNSKSVPEPTAVVGLMAVGGMFLLKRKSQKAVNLG